MHNVSGPLHDFMDAGVIIFLVHISKDCMSATDILDKEYDLGLGGKMCIYAYKPALVNWKRKCNYYRVLLLKFICKLFGAGTVMDYRYVKSLAQFRPIGLWLLRDARI